MAGHNLLLPTASRHADDHSQDTAAIVMFADNARQGEAWLRLPVKANFFSPDSHGDRLLRGQPFRPFCKNHLFIRQNLGGVTLQLLHAPMENICSADKLRSKTGSGPLIDLRRRSDLLECSLVHHHDPV